MPNGFVRVLSIATATADAPAQDKRRGEAVVGAERVDADGASDVQRLETPEDELLVERI